MNETDINCWNIIFRIIVFKILRFILIDLILYVRRIRLEDYFLICYFLCNFAMKTTGHTDCIPNYYETTKISRLGHVVNARFEPLDRLLQCHNNNFNRSNYGVCLFAFTNKRLKLKVTFCNVEKIIVYRNSWLNSKPIREQCWQLYIWTIT